MDMGVRFFFDRARASTLATANDPDATIATMGHPAVTHRPLDHDQLVQTIYDAADDPAGFTPVLARVGEALGATACHTLVLPDGAAAAENHGYGSDPSTFDEYDRLWRAHDPRFAIAMQRPSEVMSDVAVIDPQEFERSALYNEHLAKADVRYTLFTTTRAAPDLLLGQAFMRPARRGAFDVSEVSAMAALVPHFRRAARLAHVVRSLRDDVSDLRLALDLVPTGTFLLDAVGKVLCTNAAASDLLEARDGLVTRAGVLTAEQASEAQSLAAAIGRTAKMADACQWRPPPAHLTPSLFVSRARGAPLSIVMLVLRPRNQIRRAGAARARILAIVHDPDRRVRLEPALVAKVHGLTPTEAALATAVAEGRSVIEFAAERGCSEQTARTHLKRVLDKTGVRRQPELVRVLLTAVAAHQVR